LHQLRLSIAGLMALILFLAASFAALRGASNTWASIIFMTALAMLLLAILGAIYGRGPARVAWTGFALFGWAYLAITFGGLAVGSSVTIPPTPAQIAYGPIRDLLIDRMASASAPEATTGIDDRILKQVTLSGQQPNENSMPDAFIGTAYVFDAAKTPAGWTLVASASPRSPNIGIGAGDNAIGTPYNFSVALPPGTAALRPPTLDLLPVRRILHSIGAIAFALIGAILGRGLAAWIGDDRAASRQSTMQPS
jgi:hypothetical protein